MLGRYPLDCQSDDLLGFALGVAACRFADLADAIGGVGVGLLLHPSNELALGVLSGHPSHLLEAATLFADERRQLLFSLRDSLFTAAEFARPSTEIAVALLEDIGFPIEHRLALGDASFFALDFLATAANFLLEFLAKLDELFLTGDDRALAQILRFALAIGDDPLRCLFRGGLGGGEALDLRGDADPTSKKEESRRGENESAKRGSENFIHMDLCSTAEWARSRSKPRFPQGASRALNRVHADEGHELG